jgi:hypothetical protein
MTAVTALIHTHNSEKTIGRLLESISWADEIIVVDMESTDSTTKIVHARDAILHSTPPQPWNDGLRNSFLDLPTSPWTLVMDSDEYLAVDAEPSIRQLIAHAPPNVIAYALPRYNYVLGTLFDGEVSYPDHQIRLFRTGSVAYSAQHHYPPKPTDGGLVVNLDWSSAPHIHHCQDVSLTDYIQKQTQYAVSDTYDENVPVSAFQEQAIRRMLHAKERTSDSEKAMLMVLAWDAIIRGLISWERNGQPEPLPSDFGWAVGFVVESPADTARTPDWKLRAWVSHALRAIAKVTRHLRRILSRSN